jgi:uncharacterized lipoprotein NlpE involved in copper resistance
MKNYQSLMTRIWIVAAIAGILCGCGGNASKTGKTLDCEGTYIGNLPTAGGMGMTVSITLEKETYVKKTVYEGKDDVFEDRGKYTLNREDNTIVLEGITDSPNKYEVAENRLIQLDMEGKRITGESADRYVLQKTTK